VLADRAAQGRAAVAVTTHPARLVIDETGRNARERGILFERETGPVARERATGAAALTVEGCRALDRLMNQAKIR
jgi:hypothetical protein